MPFRDSWISRALIVVAAAATLYVGAADVTASAHVHASSDNATRGAMAIVTFQVPNESDKGAATTALTVALPDVASARTEAMPGWTAKLDRDGGAGRRDRRRPVRSVPHLGEAARHRNRQLPGHPDLRRRDGRQVGSAAVG